MDRNNRIEREEDEWKNLQSEIINYKHYIQYLPQNISKIMTTRVPISIHSMLPPEYVAKAISTSIEKSDFGKDEYIIEWYNGNFLILIAQLFTSKDAQLICVFHYIKNKKETVILITSNDVVSIMAKTEDVLDKLKENIVNMMKKGKMIGNNSTVIDITRDD